MYKKVSVVLLLLLLALPVALAEVTVTKIFAQNVKAGDELSATIVITTDKWMDSLDLHEFTPSGWIITGWQINGFDKANIFYETRNMFYQDKERTLSHWKFNSKFYGTITINYQLTPTDAGTFETITAWTYPNGFDSSVTYVSVLPSVINFPEAAVSILPEGEKEIVIQGITLDLTVIATATIFAGSLIFALLIVLVTSKKMIETKMQNRSLHVSTEDLRKFIRLGLKQGYGLNEMVLALRAGQIDTTEFNRVAKQENIQTVKKHVATKRKESLSLYEKSVKERKLNEIIKKLKG